MESKRIDTHKRTRSQFHNKEQLDPNYAKISKLDTSCTTLALKSTPTISIPITMNLASPTTILTSIEGVLKTVMEHPKLKHSLTYAYAQQNLIHRLKDEVGLLSLENQNMVGVPWVGLGLRLRLRLVLRLGLGLGLGLVKLLLALSTPTSAGILGMTRQ